MAARYRIVIAIRQPGAFPMKSRHFVACVFIACLPMSIVEPAFAAAPITGKWLTTERDSSIEIGRCDEARGGVICGKVIRVFKLGADGRPMLEFHNPKPEHWPEYSTPMPPMPQVSNADATKIAQWIISLKNSR